MRSMMQLTTWERPNKVINTQYGEICYHRWVEREADRIKRNPERVTEIRESTDYKGYPLVALFVDRRAG